MDIPAAAAIVSAECLCFRARRVSRLLTRMYDDELRPLGIQATQLTLLNAVAMGGEGGALMNRLADVLVMDPTTLSRNLRPLEKAGLLRLERASADRRVRIALLTTEGRKRVEEALPYWQRAHERVVQALGADAAVSLRTNLDDTVVAARRVAAVDPSPPGSSLMSS